MTDIKPRINHVPREEWTDDTREVFAFWGEPNAWEEGSKTNIISVMGNHPELGKAFNIWGKHLLMGNTLPTRILEIIILRVAVKQMMGLVFTIGHYVMTSWALSAFGVEIEGGADPIGFDLKAKSGKTPGKTYKPGEKEEWIDTRGY